MPLASRMTPVNLTNFDSIHSNANLIAAQVVAAEFLFIIREVDVVAHPKGGLDARHYTKTNTEVWTSSRSRRLMATRPFNNHF
mmetsp:Transcript_10609/g.22608  ORF Transcript_10609/g.22608 Transcript_10609/m.22608 type:complete len:83 (+) Transcript_10609:260-508(+)